VPPKERDLHTIAASNGVGTDKAFGAVTPPLHLSTTYLFPRFGEEGPYAYSRTANPTRHQLGDTLAKLEGGAGAVVTASGMAAVDLVLSRLSAGQRLVAPHDCYGGSYRLMLARAAQLRFEVVFVDQSDLAATRAALKDCALLYIETPSNPLMRVVDIEALSSLAHAAGAKVAVDNTFLSPALQRPLTLGADFVLHSTTKFLNGHSDIVGGAVVCKSPDDVVALADWANTTGVTGAPFDSYMTLRGVRTLFPRLERQQQTAAAIAEFLQAHAAVSAVHYPGLPDHPGHEIARRQQIGFGAMLSFDLRDGVPAVRAFVEALQIFSLAESLGGVESLIAHPATMTHASMGADARAVAGIGDGLIRVSVGLESERDLLEDLSQALSAITA
jgi:cystathionine gamma-synthase